MIYYLLDVLVQVFFCGLAVYERHNNLALRFDLSQNSQLLLWRKSILVEIDQPESLSERQFELLILRKLEVREDLQTMFLQIYCAYRLPESICVGQKLLNINFYPFCFLSVEHKRETHNVGPNFLVFVHFVRAVRRHAFF